MQQGICNFSLILVIHCFIFRSCLPWNWHVKGDGGNERCSPQLLTRNPRGNAGVQSNPHRATSFWMNLCLQWSHFLCPRFWIVLFTYHVYTGYILIWYTKLSSPQALEYKHVFYLNNKKGIYCGAINFWGEKKSTLHRFKDSWIIWQWFFQ